jgi:transketolase N-terminal domain/subunit
LHLESEKHTVTKLKKKATDIRITTLEVSGSPGLGHGDWLMSVTELLLATSFGGIIHHDSSKKSDEARVGKSGLPYHVKYW